MKGVPRLALLSLTACAAVACARAAGPQAAPEFTHRAAGEWINSAPLTLAALKGRVVVVEFWAFECVNCLNSRQWLQALERDKAAAGLVVVGVHTPELRAERSADNVRQAVARLGIRHAVMLDADYSYWNALRNQYWPAFYLIGRDGLLHGSAVGEMHVGEPRARELEGAIEQLLRAPVP
jgi:thiol-disulfide isomerase/thioredoxin